MNNIQYISDSYLCSNCGACSVVCPKNAISFKWSPMGRKYAYVSETCISCGKCSKVCPSIDSLNLHNRHKNRYEGETIASYLCRSSDDLIFSNAQSGGVCTSILCFLLETEQIDAALICRMDKGSPPTIKGILATTKYEILSCQRSCYTPVDLLTALKKTSSYKSLAVVGLPCHIQAVTLLQEQFKAYSNIKYKIGLICDRSLCNGILDVITSIGKENEFKVQWRKKDFFHYGTYYPYESAPVVISNENGETKKVIDNIYRFALKDMFTAPRCRLCYDKVCTHADIVLGDPWEIQGADTNHGDSIAIIRTTIGEMLYQHAVEMEYITIKNMVNVSEVYHGQHLERRNEQVATYARAYSSLFPEIKSYLLTQQASNITVEDEEQKFHTYSSEIKGFIENEKLSKDEIVNKALSIVAKSKRNQCLSKNPFFMLFVKLKKKIKL